MDFKQQLKKLAEKIEVDKAFIVNEEGTKTAFVMPFLQILGFNVFDHNDVAAEFVADVPMKKGEKVDYALKKGGKPIILVECKKCVERLDKHGIQLSRYFTFSDARFGMLTNGIKYWFFTDIDKSNVMDGHPFFQFDITDHTEVEAQFVQSFSKEIFDLKLIQSAVSEMVYSREIRTLLHNELKNSSRDFIKYVADKTFLEKQRGRVTDKVMTVYAELLRKNIPIIIDELIAERLLPKTPQSPDEDEFTSKIVTTEEELEAFFIVKAICRQKIDANRIAFRDAQAYFAIMIDNNRLKTICRIYLNASKKYFALMGVDKKEIKYEISSIDDIFGFSDQLLSAVSQYEKIK